MKTRTIAEERQAELSNCTFVKTVLMILVVIYHSIIFWTGSWFTKDAVYESDLLAMLAQWLNSFHIYGFVLVSGYLFFFLKYEKGQYSSFLPFVVNKIKRLYIPYVFVSIVWVIPFAVYYMQISMPEVIIRFALGTSPQQLWFLLMLLGAFLIFYPLSGFFEKHNFLGTIVCVIIYGIGLVGSIVIPNVLQLLSSCTYIPLFWLGFKMRQYGSKSLKRVPVLVWLSVDILLFAVSQYLSGQDGAFFKLLYHGVSFALHIFGALMAFMILQKIADKVRWKESKTLTFLGKHAMAVYLFHQQIIYLFIAWLNGRINPYLHATINFIGAMVISLLISLLLKRYIWTRKLIGEK